MKICLLCDRASQDFWAVNLSEQLAAILNTLKHETEIIVLNGAEISHCRGCFKCWIVTPGLCTICSDEINNIARLVVNSDVLLLLSQINYGGYSYDTKAFLDRFIPNISPFFTIIQGEMHHKRRYKKFPAIISIGYGGKNRQEIATFHKLTQRNALNFRVTQYSSLCLSNKQDLNSLACFLQNTINQKANSNYE